MASGLFFSPQTPGGRVPRTPGGSGLRPKLGGGLGLAQLSDSLAAIPAARTQAVQSAPSAEATSLLRSVGYHDPAPFALSSLYQQPGAAPVESASASAAQPAAVATPAPFTQPGAAEQPTDGESDEVPLAYEQMTEAVRKRLDRLARLTTDNFLREQAELDWEKERAGLVSVELDPLHLGQLHGRAEGIAASCNPVAGFTQAPLGSGMRSASGDAERWSESGRLFWLADCVERINEHKWGAARDSADKFAPLEEFSYMTSKRVADKTLDTTDRFQKPCPPCAESTEAEANPAHAYIAELFRILHAMVTPLQTRQSTVEEALLAGALQHLHTQFRGLLLTIFGFFTQTPLACKLKFDEMTEEEVAAEKRAMMKEARLKEEEEARLRSAVEFHVNQRPWASYPISYQHDSPWPKVLLLMRCGHAKLAGNLLQKYVEDLNKQVNLLNMGKNTESINANSK
jgi:hypothetical protein